MSDRAFIDTNIFAYIQRKDDPVKSQISQDTIAFFDCVISTQVVNEFSSLFTKKYPIPIDEIRKVLASIYANCELVTLTSILSDKALSLHDQYGYSFYDSLMLAATLKADCSYIITEDMQDGQLIENKIKIVDIFQHTDLLK
jgi:predicted nucleic acid-binding protein